MTFYYLLREGECLQTLICLPVFYPEETLVFPIYRTRERQSGYRFSVGWTRESCLRLVLACLTPFAKSFTDSLADLLCLLLSYLGSLFGLLGYFLKALFSLDCLILDLGADISRCLFYSLSALSGGFLCLLRFCCDGFGTLLGSFLDSPIRFTRSFSSLIGK